MRCAINDSECIPGRLRRGLCERHYRRALKHGSTANPRIDVFNHYVVASGGCWEWAGAMWGNGYGKTSVKVHGTRLAHRAFYAEHRGPIPKDMDLDHLCRNRRCVRPDHLEPVPHQINLIRGHEARTVCQSGLHDITVPGALKPGTRECVQCWRERYRAAGQRYRAKKANRQRQA